MSQDNIQDVNQDAIEQESIVAPAVETVADEVASGIEAQLSAALVDLDKARQDILYIRAEAENARRRALEENERTRKFALEKFAREVIAVKDAIDMALLDESGNFEGLKTGVDLTAKSLTNVFEKFDLLEINPIGEKLDPNKHQAISMAPSDEEANTVIQVMQKGYELSGRVIRPAMVVVAAAK
ncbi:nucleotide exchange factor GrpE [Deefgea salmonis]|uniref:Protein GrpE n=1 Tax=Deefgea salmonis TaxID=2875502 RepID=A0ABS8BMY9_9NEIS|nr:nucleotide exchange factor GrpE [Deefgea salmonis]MCB5197104.1 nucleotide exchange factor GrpE [Deefgea salmonis]